MVYARYAGCPRSRTDDGAARHELDAVRRPRQVPASLRPFGITPRIYLAGKYLPGVEKR